MPRIQNRDHYLTASRAIQEELGIARDMLLRMIEGTKPTLLPTQAWERYGSQIDPTPRLRQRLTCFLKGHDEYICGSPCCHKRTAWCMRCGSSSKVGLPAPTKEAFA